LAGLYLLLTAGFSPRFRILDSIWGPKNARECPPRIIRRSRLLYRPPAYVIPIAAKTLLKSKVGSALSAADGRVFTAFSHH
jgi:hypothetical protein